MADEVLTLPLYELGFNDLDFCGISAISLVDFPAIEKDFMAFNKNPKNKFSFSKIETEKRIVTGPALIPDKKIYRFDFFRGEYEVFFTKEIIESIRNYFLSNFKQKDVKVDHAINANNISVIESWIIEDATNDKASALGFENLPSGTWMISMKIDNDEVWKSIKDGDLKGFSIEAYLSQTLIEASKIDTELEKEIVTVIDDIEELLNTKEHINVKEISKDLDKIIGNIK